LNNAELAKGRRPKESSCPGTRSVNGVSKKKGKKEEKERKMRGKREGKEWEKNGLKKRRYGGTDHNVPI
jgi:hypothetical protein